MASVMCRMKTLITHTHTHTRFTALYPGLPRWAGTRKVKPIWILLKQETASGSGINWPYASMHLATDRLPCQHPTTQVFLQTGCPSCRPTNSVKALIAVHRKQFPQARLINQQLLSEKGIHDIDSSAVMTIFKHLIMSLMVCMSRSRVVSASDCGVRGPWFESRHRWMCLLRHLLKYTALGTGCAPLL